MSKTRPETNCDRRKAIKIIGVGGDQLNMALSSWMDIAIDGQRWYPEDQSIKRKSD